MEAPRASLGGSKRPQEPPKRPQEPPKRVQEPPKRVQETPKRPTRRSQEAPKGFRFGERPTVVGMRRSQEIRRAACSTCGVLDNASALRASLHCHACMTMLYDFSHTSVGASQPNARNLAETMVKPRFVKHKCNFTSAPVPRARTTAPASWGAFPPAREPHWRILTHFGATLTSHWPMLAPH